MTGEGLFISVGSIAAKKGPARLQLSDEARGGCACGLLADAAGWNAPTWAMTPSALTRLAVTLRRVHQGKPSGFLVKALWAGTSVTTRQPVSFAELMGLVQAGKLGTTTQYQVR